MATQDKGKQVAAQQPTKDDVNRLLKQGQKALDRWNDKPGYLKDASSMPPLTTVPCELMIGLMTEMLRLQEVEARMKGLEK
jgi:hypothetical protein